MHDRHPAAGHDLAGVDVPAQDGVRTGQTVEVSRADRVPLGPDPEGEPGHDDPVERLMTDHQVRPRTERLLQAVAEPGHVAPVRHARQPHLSRAQAQRQVCRAIDDVQVRHVQG